MVILRCCAGMALVAVLFIGLSAANPTVLPCSVANQVLTLDSVLFNSSCTNITWVNVTARSGLLNISLPLMELADPTARRVWVNMTNCTFVNGTVVLVDGHRSIGVWRVALSVTIQQLWGIDAAIGFTGHFPPQTRIVLSNASISNSAESFPVMTLRNLDPVDADVKKLLLFSNLTLTDDSHLVVQNSLFKNWKTCPTVDVAAGLSIKNGSSLSFVHLTLDAEGVGAVLIDTATIAIEQQSTWAMCQGCNVICDGAASFQFRRGSRLSLRGFSTLLLEDTTMLSPNSGSGIILDSSDIQLEGGSAWLMQRTNIFTRNSAIYAQTSVIRVTNNSVWRWFRVNLTSIEAFGSRILDTNITVSDFSALEIADCDFSTRSTTESRAAFQVDAASRLGTYLRVERDSVWSISSSRFEVAGSHAPFRAPLRFGSATYPFFSLQFSMRSSWILRDTALTTPQLADTRAMQFSANASMVADASSWVLWASNRFTAFGTGCVKNFGGTFSASVVSMIENSCNGTITGSLFADSAPLVLTASVFYERCNRADGLLRRSGIPTEAISAGACDACNVSAECFAPLTNSASTCILQVPSGVTACYDCLNGGQGDLCLPKRLVLTAAPPQTTLVSTTTAPSATTPTTTAPTQTSMAPTTAAPPQATMAPTTPAPPQTTLVPTTTAMTQTTLAPTNAAPITSAPKPVTARPPTAQPPSPRLSSQEPPPAWTAEPPTSTVSLPPTTATLPLQTGTQAPVPAEDVATSTAALMTAQPVAPVAPCSVQPFEASLELTAPGYATASNASHGSTIVDAGASFAMAKVVGTGAVATVLFRPLPGWALIVTNQTEATALSSLGAVTNVSVNISMAVVVVSFSSLVASELPVSNSVVFSVTVRDSVRVVSNPSCAGGGLGPNASSPRLWFECTALPLMPASNPKLEAATATTFQATTTASAFLLNPVVAMSNTAMVSVRELRACVFSDVEPLDPAMSPLEVALGAVRGQYYRGCVAVGLGGYGASACGLFLLHLVLRRALGLADSLESVRFPSLLIVVVSLAHQGIVSSSTSLLRLHATAGDVVLGASGIALSVALTVGVLVATTTQLPCRIAKRGARGPGAFRGAYDRVTAACPALRHVLWPFQWDSHWVDAPAAPGYKRRFLLLLEDMRRPWWVGAEMASGICQGLLVGVRVNVLDTCRVLIILLMVHCLAMLVLAAVARPFGAPAANGFLLVSKLGAFLVAVLQVAYVHAPARTDLLESAEAVSSVFTFVSGVQTVLQLVAAAGVLFDAVGAWRTADERVVASGANHPQPSGPTPGPTLQDSTIGAASLAVPLTLQANSDAASVRSDDASDPLQTEGDVRNTSAVFSRQGSEDLARSASAVLPRQASESLGWKGSVALSRQVSEDLARKASDVLPRQSSEALSRKISAAMSRQVSENPDFLIDRLLQGEDTAAVLPATSIEECSDFGQEMRIMSHRGDDLNDLQKAIEKIDGNRRASSNAHASEIDETFEL